MNAPCDLHQPAQQPALAAIVDSINTIQESLRAIHAGVVVTSLDWDKHALLVKAVVCGCYARLEAGLSALEDCMADEHKDIYGVLTDAVDRLKAIEAVAEELLCGGDPDGDALRASHLAPLTQAVCEATHIHLDRILQSVGEHQAGNFLEPLPSLQAA